MFSFPMALWKASVSIQSVTPLLSHAQTRKKNKYNIKRVIISVNGIALPDKLELYYFTLMLNTVN